jgi:hypothetical protein
MVKGHLTRYFDRMSSAVLGIMSGPELLSRLQINDDNSFPSSINGPKSAFFVLTSPNSVTLANLIAIAFWKVDKL